MNQDARVCTTMLCKAESKAREIAKHLVYGVVTLPISAISAIYIQLIAFHTGNSEPSTLSALLHPAYLTIAVPLFLRSVYEMFSRFRNALLLWGLE